MPVRSENTECGESCNKEEFSSRKQGAGSRTLLLLVHTLSVESSRRLFSKVDGFSRRQTMSGDSGWGKD